MGLAVPLSEADTITVTVEFSVTVTVAWVQELEKAREVPASFTSAGPDSIIVRY